ncbi:hypothetical protein TCA2_2690 [Paenibacillus sp. TCA20]|nr:hypothetical protein TCA2_2690 [Paenibacillus sp. TCA20]
MDKAMYNIHLITTIVLFQTLDKQKNGPTYGRPVFMLSLNMNRSRRMKAVRLHSAKAQLITLMLLLSTLDQPEIIIVESWCNYTGH